MKRLLIILVSFLFLKDANAKTERYYQEIHCELVGGEMEVKTRQGTRIDCLTVEKAIEYDFARKWAECGLQSLSYAALKDKIPECILIGSRKDYDKYSQRLQLVVDHYDLPLEISWIPE